MSEAVYQPHNRKWHTDRLLRKSAFIIDLSTREQPAHALFYYSHAHSGDVEEALRAGGVERNDLGWFCKELMISKLQYEASSGFHPAIPTAEWPDHWPKQFRKKVRTELNPYVFVRDGDLIDMALDESCPRQWAFIWLPTFQHDCYVLTRTIAAFLKADSSGENVLKLILQGKMRLPAQVRLSTPDRLTPYEPPLHAPEMPEINVATGIITRWPAAKRGRKSRFDFDAILRLVDEIKLKKPSESAEKIAYEVCDLLKGKPLPSVGHLRNKIYARWREARAERHS